MAPSESEIRTLISTQSYSPVNVAKLEEYLLAQASGEAPYLFDAVRALIKHYQLFPESCGNEGKIGYACLLTMLEFPGSSNFLAISYMIPLTILGREPCATIRRCAELLDNCRFAEFWKSYDTLVKSSDPVVSNLSQRSIARLQQGILSVLALSYKQAPISLVRTALNIPDDVLPASSSIEKVTDQNVVFTASIDNTKRQRVYQESVSYATIGSLLKKIAQ